MIWISLPSCHHLRYGGSVSSANAREAELVGEPVHVELEVGVDPESVWLGATVSPAGDANDTVAGVRVLGEERSPAVTLDNVQDIYISLLSSLLHTLQVSVLGATAQIMPSVILASPMRSSHLSQDTGTNWASSRTVEMEEKAGLVRPQPVAQVSLQ